MTSALPDGVSRYHAAIAVVVTACLTAILWFTAEPVTPLLFASLVLAIGLLVADAFDRIRTHPVNNVVSNAVITILFVIWYVEFQDQGLFPLILALVAAMGFLVELYNYRYGTSHLRIEW